MQNPYLFCLGDHKVIFQNPSEITYGNAQADNQRQGFNLLFWQLWWNSLKQTLCLQEQDKSLPPQKALQHTEQTTSRKPLLFHALQGSGHWAAALYTDKFLNTQQKLTTHKKVQQTQEKAGMNTACCGVCVHIPYPLYMQLKWSKNRDQQNFTCTGSSSSRCLNRFLTPCCSSSQLQHNTAFKDQKQLRGLLIWILLLILGENMRSLRGELMHYTDTQGRKMEALANPRAVNPRFGLWSLLTCPEPISTHLPSSTHLLVSQVFVLQ